MVLRPSRDGDARHALSAVLSRGVGSTLYLIYADNCAQYTHDDVTGVRNADDPGGSEGSPFTPVDFAQDMLVAALKSSCLFDLGVNLSWVPRRISEKEYTLTITNNDLLVHPLVVTSKIGAISTVVELPIGQSEKSVPIGYGWLPFGYDTEAVREGTLAR